MTWGSNASYRTIRCPFCKGDMIDDTDSGPSTHELVCPRRTLFRRLARWLRSW